MTTRTKRQTIAVMVAPFDIKELRELMSYDELELDMLGDRKTALKNTTRKDASR